MGETPGINHVKALLGQDSVGRPPEREQTFTDGVGFQPTSAQSECFDYGFSVPTPIDSVFQQVLLVYPRAADGPIHTAKPEDESAFLSNAASFCPNGECTAFRDEFTIIAVGNIDQDEFLDVWIIDERRVITHVLDDTINGPPPPPANSNCAQTPADAQNNARSALTGLYTLEQVFFSEYGTHSTFIDGVGFQPTPAQSECFDYGFSVETPLDTFFQIILNVFPAAADGPINTAEPSDESTFLSDAASFCPNGVCTAFRDEFTIIAVGNIDQDANLDVWLINERQILTHVLDDTINGPPPPPPASNCSLSPETAQANAQSALNGLFTTEQAFFAEYGEYSTYIDRAGFGATAGQLECFNFGFSVAAPLSSQTLTVFPAANSGPIHTAATSETTEFLSAAQSFCPGGVCTVNGSEFTFIAVGNIDNDNTLDIWLIDESRNITHVVDDLTN